MTPDELEVRFQTLGCEMALLEAEAALLQADFDMLDFYRCVAILHSDVVCS
jgi:hypothetical protein